jgi:hypothetical protein
MAGFIGRIQRSQDGKTYGFLVYDEISRPSLYLGFSSKVEADTARTRDDPHAGDRATLRATLS